MSGNPAETSLVTGATGLVGATLVRQLLAAGERVRILRRRTSPLDLLGDDAGMEEEAEGDVTDPYSVRDAVRGVSRVWHVAGLIDLGGAGAERRLFDVNAGGTAHVVDAALDEGVDRIVHVSSIAALGRAGASDAMIDESVDWVASPSNTTYARSKRAAELEVQRGVAEGLDAVIVNPALVFGRGRAGEGTMRVVERVASGGMRVAPPGATCVVDVEDVALGMRAAMARGTTGERYILGSENLTWMEALSTLAEAMGRPAPARAVSARALRSAALLAEGVARISRTRPLLSREQARAGAELYRYSNRKAVEELGLSFRPFSETARRLAEEMRG
jgi:dihydroflavonol-4-reductase